MTDFLGTFTVCSLCAGAAWHIAAWAARRRNIMLGSAPVIWLATAATAATALCADDKRPALLIPILAVAAIVDARSGYIFDPIVAFALGAVLTGAVASGELRRSLEGAAVTAGLFLAIWALSGGRGLGFGDVKLAAALGAGLGVADGILAAGTAFVLGGAAAVVLLAARAAGAGTAVRFGPFLLAGTLLVLAYHRVKTGS